jgi:hypothetical protein
MKRPPVLIILAAALSLAALGAGLYWRQRAKPPASSGARNAEATASLPPFSTKEPDRYQANRITTARSSDSGHAEQANVDRVFIARDGDKRREDYDLGGVSISYLELGAARYALFPAQKIYVELNDDDQFVAPADLGAEFSPDRLLNESPVESHYELLGDEILDGRKTTRYRVTTANVTGTDSVKTETLIWIDQSLHLPLKSETKTAASGGFTSFITSLENVSENVDGAIFELPSGFRKVSAQEFERQLRIAQGL